MSAQFVQLGPFFLDGELCGGATLEHYAAGTNTTKDIWEDRAQTLPLSNPFTSDAGGVFNFYADGLYRIIIKKADGDTLYTIDNWQMLELTQSSAVGGSPVTTASSMNLGGSTWAHWTGSNNVSTLTGSAIFYWAMCDGNFTLIHSASLIMPDSRNRKVLSGDVLFFINEGAGIFRLGGHMQKEGGWTGRQAASATSGGTLTVPTDGDLVTITGGSTITAVAVASAGYRFRALFSAGGLNITHNATSMISPWGRDYRTVANELIEFLSLGSGNWMFFSVNGPKERVGQTIEWNSPNDPVGFLEEIGGTFSRTSFPGLFAEIGTTWGSGDGTTTAGLPDRRGRTGIGVDGTANRVTSASTGGVNADTLGGTGGAEMHTLTTAQSPAHDHGKNLSAGTLGNADVAGTTNQTTVLRTDFSVQSAGGGGAHNNMQPWVAKRYFIRF